MRPKHPWLWSPASGHWKKQMRDKLDSQATHSEEGKGFHLPAVCSYPSPRPLPVPPGGSPPPTLLLLLPPLPLLPQLQSVWVPPLLPCRLLPPGRRQDKRDLCQVKGRCQGW